MHIDRWLQQPVLSATLLVIWLLLMNQITAGQIVLGIILSLVIPLFTRAFWPQRPHFRHLGVLLKLAVRVALDILIANISAARLILGPRSALRPGFVSIPLELTDPYAIAILANVISLTPGTVSANLSTDAKYLLVHALDSSDEAALFAHIKQHYERPLKEIFEC
jgi:multicomponent K+:H+ antiporter subunit E